MLSSWGLTDNKVLESLKRKVYQEQLLDGVWNGNMSGEILPDSAVRTR
jgi:hypothetical protein